MGSNSNKKTKMELVENIHAKTSCSLATVKEVVDLFIGSLRESLENGSTIELRGFGTFEVRHRRGRKSARNPKTGEQVSVSEHSVVVFRAGRDLKEAVWSYKASESPQKRNNASD